MTVLQFYYVLMSNEEIIIKTVEFVKQSMWKNDASHDWWHIYRVWKTAKHIGGKEQVNMLVVELWALLHDIADHKFYDGDEEIWPATAKAFLESLHVDVDIVQQVYNIVKYISFKWWHNTSSFTSPELSVVQDADRLDAVWAIWIARTFAYGWYKWRELYNPHIPPMVQMTKEEYMKSDASPTINHFYEKLLLLRDKMNTVTWREMAEHRHHYMEWFLKEFYGEREWTL